MKIGTMIEELLEYFKAKHPMIEIVSDIVKDEPNVYEVYVKFQNSKSINNKAIELIKHNYAYLPYGYGEETLVWVGVGIDEYLHIGFRFQATGSDKK